MHIAEPSHATLGQLVVAASQRHAALSAFTCMGRTVSFGELDRHSLELALWFHHQLGLEPGDRIAIQLPNILQYPLVAIAALRLGLVLVNTNPLYTSRELRHQLQDSEVRVVVVLSNIAESLSQVVEDTAVEHVLTTEIADLHRPGKKQFYNLVARLRKPCPDMSRLSCTALAAALSLGAAMKRAGLSLPAVPTDPDALAMLQYTGGTTGLSKGAMLSHRNLLANMAQIRERMHQLVAEPGLTLIAPLPLYHIYAFMVAQLFSFEHGLHSVLVPNPRDTNALVSLLCRQRFEAFIGIGTLYSNLLEHRRISKVNFGRMRFCSSGGMPLTASISRRWHALTGKHIIDGYGLTEASPCISCSTIEDWQEGTVGQPLEGTEICIRDGQGKALPPEQAGEICVRGPQVMMGYWRRPDETSKVIDAEGWLQTGDVGQLRESGHLQLLDRKKDVIIVSGFNVYPSEIEAFVTEYAGVKEAVAVGVSTDEGMERVKLVVVPQDESLTMEEVISWCREGLAAYKVPRIIEFRESLPKSNVGKVLRGMLQESADA